MAVTNIYTGPWIDWSQGNSILAYVVALNAQSATVLTNFIAIFISTFVAGFAWSITAYCLHQRFQRHSEQSNDVLQSQHRLVWRNSDSAMGAVFDILVLYWAWRPWPLVSSEQRPKSNNLGRRTLIALIWPLIVATGFSVASIFSSRIILSGNRGSDVLLSQLDYDSCGHLVYSSPSGYAGAVGSTPLALYQQTATQDNLAAQTYAESCYFGKDNGNPALSCSVYPVARLPYTARLRKSFCPFGDRSLPFNMSPCNSTLNTGSYEMWTDMLDSNSHFGINASPEDRVKLQRNVTCSTINVQTYKGVRNKLDPRPVYRLGSSQALVDVGDDITFGRGFSYSFVAKLTSIVYSYEFVAPYYYTTPSTTPYQPNSFDPVSDFDVINADRTLLFFNPFDRDYGPPYYKHKVLDPFYLATKRKKGYGGGYGVTNPASIMACIDHYQLCNPTDGLQCTHATSLAGLKSAMRNLRFNAAQNVTAQRLHSVLENSNTYTNMFTAQSPLQVPSSYVAIPFYGVIGQNMPSDQWTREVKLWFEYGLAKMQQKATGYVSSSGALRQLARENFPTKDPVLLREFKRQCSTQRVKNNGDFTTISLFGVVLVLVIGSLLSLIGFGFHRAIPLWRHTRFRKSRSKASLSREYTYSADSKYLLQYMAFADALRQEPMKVVADIPVFRGNPRVPEPRPGFGGTYSYKSQSKTKTPDEVSETLDTVGDEPGFYPGSENHRTG